METPEPGERRRRGTPDPAPTRPPNTTLSRAPGERFVTRAGEAGSGTRTEADGEDRASAARGLAWAALVAVAGAALLTVLAGVFAVSFGLVVVAAVVGRFVGLGLRAGARGGMTRRARETSGVAFAVGSVVVAQLGIWAYARSEGGALGPADYLGQTFGWLVPLQLVVAAVAAWFASR